MMMIICGDFAVSRLVLHVILGLSKIDSDYLVMLFGRENWRLGVMKGSLMMMVMMPLRRLP